MRRAAAYNFAFVTWSEDHYNAARDNKCRFEAYKSGLSRSSSQSELAGLLTNIEQNKQWRTIK
ncbi:hypothetical protein HCH_04114 [Hahella chejuensis KCTC 2396]|uniref:Uncharacterized protein n=1 Tax=Hahella chejuensis (strain KCTC 2396) TaxID=349521 RepID=Q2SEV0_HAHCH|nr:hypothetical protein HCH_04114 [Hahella chejuensis KCTC 2396]